jgi:predicted RNA binding protein YcfA (HicA-like mRNA interferase family)
MPIDQTLLDKARLRPHALRLDEALRLSRQLGFEKVRQVRGHRILRHAAAVALNLQAGRDGYAKAYQVRRMLEVSRA